MNDPLEKRLTVIENKINEMLSLLTRDNPVPGRNIVQLMPVIQAMRKKLQKGGDKNGNQKERQRMDDRPLPGERRASEVSV